MSTAETPFRWRSIALPALLPTVLFSIGEGAIIPIIPIAADNLGATLAIAAVVAGCLTIGDLFGTVPSGWLVARIGERRAMVGAIVLSILGLAICLLSPNPLVLGIGILLIGLSAAVFGLARHSFLTSFVPLAYRARALSTLGGTFRLGYFVGPFITAGVIHLTGTASSAFWIHFIACVGAGIILLTLPDPAKTFGLPRAVAVDAEPLGLFQTIHNSRRVLSRLGIGAALIGGMRASRQVILPLWAVSIGVSDTNTAIIIGIAGAVDFALFYTGGFIMDRYGRLWTALPSMVGLGLGHLVLAFTHDVPANVSWFIFAAMFLSLANGVGSGILMTLGSDLADVRNPAPFLGAWRFTAGLGGAGAPLLLAGITATASIAIAAGAIGALGLLGAAVLARYMPQFVPRAGRVRP
jgi:MFS family permease